MSFFTEDNLELARDIISRYPVAKSALIPLCHLAQQQEGHLSESAMAEIAELVDVTPAEVIGTASFYEMFKLHPVGRYVVNICTNISCQLVGAEDLLHHAEETLGVRAGGTTDDGMFTLEDVECMAACTEAPCLQVNYRYALRVGDDDFDEIVAALRNGETPERLIVGEPGDPIPSHGTLGLVRQQLPDERRVDVVAPGLVDGPPVWLAANREEAR